MKDLGGGGLSCCLSEISVTLSKGLEIDISKIHVKEDGMSPSEIMISESQERMLVVTSQTKLTNLIKVLEKYNLRYSIIGSVKGNRNLRHQRRRKRNYEYAVIVYLSSPTD